MPQNILVIENGLRYSGAMLLALANKITLPAGAALAKGAGTHQNPFVLENLAQWRTPAPPNISRIFMNIGGRMLMKRVNRGPDGWDGYVTDLGPLEEAKARLGRQEPLKANYPSTATEQKDGRGPHHRTNTARQSDPRWYMEGGIDQNDPMYDGRLYHRLGADYADICASLIDYLLKNGEGDSGMARRIRKVVLEGSDTVADLPPSAALLCTAWFSAESGRHPRSVLSSMILLRLIEDGVHIQLPGANVDIAGMTQVKFSTVIQHSSPLPHPMAGKGTVKDAAAAAKRNPGHAQTLEDERPFENPATLKGLNKVTAGQVWDAIQNLNVVEKREAEIFMEWLARTLVNHGGLAARKAPEDYKLSATSGEQVKIDDQAHPSVFPRQRPAGFAVCDENIVFALKAALEP